MADPLFSTSGVSSVTRCRAARRVVPLSLLASVALAAMSAPAAAAFYPCESSTYCVWADNVTHAPNPVTDDIQGVISTADAMAWGFKVNGASGRFTMNGDTTLDVNAVYSYYSDSVNETFYGYAYGYSATTGGVLTVNGATNLTVTSTADHVIPPPKDPKSSLLNYAYGINADGSGTVITVNNLTTLTVTATSGSSDSYRVYGYAFGHYATGGSVLSITGNADITVTSSSTGYTTYAYAYGHYTTDGSILTVTGDTTLKVTATSTGGAATRVALAYGYQSAGGVITINGNSDITATAAIGDDNSMSAASAEAIGFYVSNATGSLTVNGDTRLNLSSEKTAYGYITSGGVIAINGNSEIDVSAGTSAYGYRASGGSISVTGDANLDLSGNDATGISVTNATVTLNGAVRFDIDGTTTATGISVGTVGRVTLTGGSDFTVSGATVYGINASNNGSVTTQGFVTLTNATMNLSGSSSATSIYATESIATTHNMQIGITNSTFNSSGSGIVLSGGKLGVSLTNSTMNNDGNIAFDVASRTDKGRLFDTTYPAALTVTAANSKFNGSSTTAGSNAVFHLTMADNSLWTGASGNLTNLTLNDSTVTFAEPSNGLFSTLTVDGNYSGNNGHMYLHAKLNDDASPADLLHVKGDTSGTTTLHVLNAGGSGALTTGNGILLVQVDGASNGAFSLAGDYVTPGGNQAVVAGAYAYTLQHPDNNWYLQSQDCPVYGCTTPPSSGGAGVGAVAGGAGAVNSGAPVLYHPFVPVAEAYAANMARVVVDMETFRQRMGGHYDALSSMGMFAGIPATTGSISSTQSPDFAGVPGLSGIPIALPVNSDGTPMYMWADVRGSRNSMKAHHSTTGVSSTSTDWEIRSGFDAMLWEQDNQHLMGGLNVFYGGSSTETKSVYGNGDLDMRRYGVGATLTWYNDSGTYVDFQGKAMWFNNDLQADALGSLTYRAKAFGWAASVEVGHEFNITDSFSLTPQAQLTYGTIDFKNFKDRFNNTYDLRNSASLRGRLGIEAAYTWSSTNAAGETSQTRLYGTANVYHEFRDEKTVSVAGVALENRRDKNWAGLGVGVSHTWQNGKYRVFGEVEATSSLKNHESHGISGRIGFVMRF